MQGFQWFLLLKMEDGVACHLGAGMEEGVSAVRCQFRTTRTLTPVRPFLGQHVQVGQLPGLRNTLHSCTYDASTTVYPRDLRSSSKGG